MTTRTATTFFSFAFLLTQATLADLVLRLDAGGLTPGALSSWTDTSNNAFDASQANAANQPSVVNGGAAFNNLNVVQFTGNSGANNDWLDNPSVGYDAQTVLAVFKVNTSLRSTAMLGQIWGQYGGTASAHVATDFRAGAAQDHGWSFDGDATTSPQARFARDGSTFVGPTSNTTALPWSDNTAHLITTEFTNAVSMTQHLLGSLAPSFNISTHAFGGEIAEILVFNNTLSSDERTGLEHLMAQRWGLTGPGAANAGQIAAANALFPSGLYVIPEPSSLSLLGLGLLGLLGLTARRRGSSKK